MNISVHYEYDHSSHEYNQWCIMATYILLCSLCNCTYLYIFILLSRLYHYTIFITFKVQQKHFDTIQKEKVCYSKRSVGHGRYHSGAPWGDLPLLYWPGESTAVFLPVCYGDISATILCRSRICINICQMSLLCTSQTKKFM